ncbi:MAG: type II toxin-antitoxin system death-on-curing family toxin [Candidatus Hydrogenedentota bacterium]|nr:MAG: type II toxin-antitoxin system death-on-curing family toxin [Candidatus Hydrogenedentota bacterium]
MDEPLFLELTEGLEVHRSQIERYGGSHGVRDLGLLESAVETPRATFGEVFLHSDLFEMAAAYLYHIAMNHPFIDGNKRTAFVAALVFLRMNGYHVPAADTRNYGLVLGVAEGRIAKSTAAEFFRKYAKPLK